MATEEKLREFGQLICKVAAGKTITREETCEAYRQIILNEQPELQQGAFLAAHITRKPTIEELSGVWDALDRFDTEKFKADLKGVVCDIVGTGSDSIKTVNASSPAALIASACGVPIAKKGAKKVTGVSGASEIFEILGVNLSSPMSKAKQGLEKHNICYMPGEAFLKSGWARLIQYMRFTTALNIVGPLTMPCENTSCIVIGAYAPQVCDQLIAVLKETGISRAVAPYGMVKGINSDGGDGGIDEFSPCGPTRVVELTDGEIRTYIVQPEDFGVKTHSTFDIASFNKAYDNAAAIKQVLSGKYDHPLADLFCMNAAAALYVSGACNSYRDGMEKAREALNSGKALSQLHHLVNQQA